MSTGHIYQAQIFIFLASKWGGLMCFCPPAYFDLAAPNPNHFLCRVSYLYIGLTLSDANITNPSFVIVYLDGLSPFLSNIAPNCTPFVKAIAAGP